jgi:superfamily I DNA/RNA helicase
VLERRRLGRGCYPATSHRTRLTRGTTAAARDTNDQVRVLAGPGTGKSSAVEERCWLIGDCGLKASRVLAVEYLS